MGMDFGDGPDFDAIHEERNKSKQKEAKVELKEDDCWNYLYTIQHTEPTENDSGLRQVFKNTITNQFRMKKVIDQKILQPGRTNVKINIWDWVD